MGAWQVIFWWEARRLFFNLIVGVVGLVVVAILFICGLVSEKIVGEAIGIPDPPIFGVFAVFAYGIMANVCYTGGWIVELVVRAAWGRDVPNFGERAFSLGLWFSVFLTLVPAFLVVLVAGITIVSHLWRGT